VARKRPKHYLAVKRRAHSGLTPQRKKPCLKGCSSIGVCKINQRVGGLQRHNGRREEAKGSLPEKWEIATLTATSFPA